MSVPALTVQIQGQGAVSADMLNTYQQTCDDYNDLLNFVGVEGMQVYMRGFSTPADGGQGVFYWNPNGVAADDGGITTIVPYSAGSGEWTRLNESIQGSLVLTGSLTVGTTLAVTGNFAVNTNKFTVAAATGNTLIAGTLTVTGTTALNDDTAVDGDLDVTGALSIDGNGAVGGDLTVTGSITPGSMDGIVGTTTDDDANAGSVGEYIEAAINVGAEVSLANGTAANVTSINLTAGDWDVWGNVFFTNAGGTTMTYAIGALNTTSATLPTQPNSGAMCSWNGSLVGSANTQILSAGARRLSLTSTTQVYLIAYAAFSGSTSSAGGFIGARRRR